MVFRSRKYLSLREALLSAAEGDEAIFLRRLLRFARHDVLTAFLIIFLVSPTIYAQENIKETEQLEFAQGLLSRGMYDMAIAQCQKFIVAYPHSSSLEDAYLSLGEGYFLSQDFNKAVDTFNQFNQLYPHSDKLPLSLLRLGQIDIQLGKYDEALKELTSIDAQKQLKGPMLQSFDFFTAQAYLGRGDSVSALDYFQKASSVDGASDYTAYALKETGKIQASDGHYADALASYAKSMSLADDNSLKGELVYRIAESNFLSGQYPDAIKGFAQVVAQYPDLGFTPGAVANMLLAYFNLGQYGQLLDQYQKLSKEIANDDADFVVHFTAVKAYIELKQYDQADALLDKILAFSDLKPKERAKVFIKKSDVLIREKKYRDAMALLDAYAAGDIDDADETLFLRAQACFGLKDYDRAFSFFENVFLNFPNSRFARAALLGQAHARQEAGRYKESEGLFLKYDEIQDQPDLESEALYDAVMMAVKAGDVSGVISAAQAYIKVFPTGVHYSEVLLILADDYDKTNQAKDAVALLQGYLASPQSSQRPNAANFLLGFNQQLLGNKGQALAAYILVDQHKEDGRFYVEALKNMAIIYLSQENFDKARFYFDLLINQADQNDLQLKTYVWVCNEYLKEQKYDDVLRVATQAQKHFPAPDLLQINYFEAEALRGLGRCDEALKDYSLVNASTVSDTYTGNAHIGDGLCLAQAQKYEEAKNEFQKSLDQNADNAGVTIHARFEMAQVDEAQGNLDEAVKFYLLVATIYDDPYYCPQSLLKAGEIFERQKRRGDALKMYAEILDKYKNSAAAQEAQERVHLLK